MNKVWRTQITQSDGVDIFKTISERAQAQEAANRAIKVIQIITGWFVQDNNAKISILSVSNFNKCDSWPPNWT